MKTPRPSFIVDAQPDPVDAGDDPYGFLMDLEFACEMSQNEVRPVRLAERQGSLAEASGDSHARPAMTVSCHSIVPLEVPTDSSTEGYCLVHGL